MKLPKHFKMRFYILKTSDGCRHPVRLTSRVGYEDILVDWLSHGKRYSLDRILIEKKLVEPTEAERVLYETTV